MGPCYSKTRSSRAPTEKTTPSTSVDTPTNRRRRLTEKQKDDIRSEYELNMARSERDVIYNPSSPTVTKPSPIQTARWHTLQVRSSERMQSMQSPRIKLDSLIHIKNAVYQRLI